MGLTRRHAQLQKQYHRNQQLPIAHAHSSLGPVNSINAMLCSTRLLTYLTVLARVPLGTSTVVLVRLGVYTGASVHAGMVRPTVVQICMKSKNTSQT